VAADPTVVGSRSDSDRETTTALPELETVAWRPRVDAARLDRQDALWTLTTVAHVVPFLAAAAVLVWVNREPPEPLFHTNFQGQPYLFPWFAGLVGVALVGLAHSEVLGGLVDNPVARYTARISFGIYIWHYLLLEGFAHITGGWYSYGRIANASTHFTISMVMLALTYAIAAASWRWIERPALESRWANRR